MLTVLLNVFLLAILTQPPRRAPSILLTPFQNERQFNTVSCVPVKHKRVVIVKRQLETSKLHMAKYSCVSDDV